MRDSMLRIPTGALVTIGSPADERARAAQALGAPLDGSQFRAASTMMPLRRANGASSAAVILPQLRLTHNSELPYSLNDAGMWAGRGRNLSVLAGGMAWFGRLRVILAPEITHSSNADYDLADTTISPPVPRSRNPFSSPWHAGAQSVDLPIRFGDQPLTRLSPGQSSITFDTGPIIVGAATENEWWGPGMRNALVLSNNAAGFPHLLVGTSRPWMTRLGALEGRWLAGGLTESAFFDGDATNDLRAISMTGVSLRPRLAPTVVIGATRAVFSASSSWAAALAGFPSVLRDVGTPNEVSPADSTHPRGSDALLSLFARWVMPASGLEMYAEWGRAQMPTSPRDFLVQPVHSQGYTLGLQWLSDRLAITRGRVRVQAEGTTVEQSTTFRFRNIGSWYTSFPVEQGYTERGQPLGASIGPGASSQFLAVDHVAARWQLGGYVSRVRWLQDVRSQKSRENDTAYCGQDVSLLPGGRARVSTPAGDVGLDYSSGWRLNVFFQQYGTCFELPSRDQRNRSLTLTFSPGLHSPW